MILGSLPYSFSNFAWWTDSELRGELKQHIPGLGDEVACGSVQEAQVRDQLTAMLAAKGIQATVLSVEPSATSTTVSSFVAKLPFFIPGASKQPHIVFTISSPQITVGSVDMVAPPLPEGAVMARTVQKLAGHPFDSRALNLQAQQLSDPLQRDGYLSARARIVTLRPQRQGEGYVVPLRAEIDPGPLYHVGMVSADGGPLLRDRDLSAYFDVQAGEIATPYAFQRLESSIMTVYFQAGYPAVHFKDEPVLDPDSATASYRLEVVTGPQYHLRTLVVNNLTPAQETEVRNLLALQPGDIYDQLAVDELHQKVQGHVDLRGLDYSFAPSTDRQNNVIDLTLDFFKDTAQSSL
jgi:outer membrane translocation and assembly module TamA